MDEKTNKNPCCETCGNTVSRRNKSCRNCFFSRINFEPKQCLGCKQSFVPKSGIALYCDICRFTCRICKKPRNKCGATGKPKLCQKCSKIFVKYSLICKLCGNIFEGKTNKISYCSVCDLIIYPRKCIDCNKTIGKYHKRCNKCSALNRMIKDNDKSFTKKTCEYNGEKYRSNWEIEVVKILNKNNILFEYERKDEITQTRPDFYFKEIDYYLEVHPDYWGENKIIPDNCLLVKTLEDAKAAAEFFSWKLNKNKYLDSLKYFTRKEFLAQEKRRENFNKYLKNYCKVTNEQELEIISRLENKYKKEIHFPDIGIKEKFNKVVAIYNNIDNASKYLVKSLLKECHNKIKVFTG